MKLFPRPRTLAVVLCSITAAAILAWCFAAPITGYCIAQYDTSKGHFELQYYGIYRGWDERCAELLKERYGVIHRPVAGCVVSHWTSGYVGGYDGVVFGKLEKKYGKNVLRECDAQAYAEFQKEISQDKNRPNQPLQGTPGTVPSASTEPEARRP
jgi:hypothetical protein